MQKTWASGILRIVTEILASISENFDFDWGGISSENRFKNPECSVDRIGIRSFFNSLEFLKFQDTNRNKYKMLRAITCECPEGQTLGTCSLHDF